MLTSILALVLAAPAPAPASRPAPEQLQAMHVQAYQLILAEKFELTAGRDYDLKVIEHFRQTIIPRPAWPTRYEPVDPDAP
jgi:hypothetical protein